MMWRHQHSKQPTANSYHGNFFFNSTSLRECHAVKFHVFTVTRSGRFYVKWKLEILARQAGASLEMFCILLRTVAGFKYLMYEAALQ